MTKKKIKEAKIGSAFDLLGKSWELVKRNWQMFVVVNIFGILASAGKLFRDGKENTHHLFGGLVPTSGWENADGLGWELSPMGVTALILLVIIVFSFVMAMSTKLELMAAKGKKPTFGELFDAGRIYWLRLLGLMVLCGLIVVVGLLLLIVPGIIALGRLIFASYIMMDRDLGIIDSIKTSNKLSYGRAGYVWPAIGVTVLVGLATGILANIPLIGELLGMAVGIAFSLVIALRYLQIKKIAKV